MAFSWKVLFFLTILLVTISNQAVYVNAQTLQSPLKQLESGIKIQDIKCKEGFVLGIKESNDQPSCVRPTSEQRLLAHGWIIPKFETSHPIVLPQNEAIILNQKQNTTNQSIIQNNETTIISNQTNTNNTIITSTLNSSSIPWTLVSMTKPEIKILSIGMTPNPLKVGDKPEFTMSFQNISDKMIGRAMKGCDTNPSLHWKISPLSNVQVVQRTGGEPLCVSIPDIAKPNGI